MLPEVSCRPELFRPLSTNPAICRWWVTPPRGTETMWEPFCCHSGRMGMNCPTRGRKPYELEEDGFQDHVDLGG